MPTVSRWQTIAAISALTVAGLAIRAAAGFNGGLWRDEALLLGVVDIPTWQGMLEYLRFHESHPPLFYGVMRIWRSLAGRTDAAAVLLPVLLGAALIPASHAAAASLFSRSTAWITSSLICIAAPLIGFGSSVRPYSFLALAVLLSTFSLAVALESRQKGAWALYSASAAVLIYTHNWAWLVIAGHTVSVIVVAARARSYRRRNLPAFALSLGVAGLVFLPWFPTLLRQAANAGHFPEPLSGPGDALDLIYYSLLMGLNAILLPPVQAGRMIVVAAAVLACVILAVGSRRKPAGPVIKPPARNPVAATVFVVTPSAAMLMALALYQKTNLLIPACISSLAPLVLMTAASYVSRATGLSAGRLNLGRGASVVAMIVMLVGGYTAGVYELLVRPRSNARELTGAMRTAQREGDVVIVAPGWLVSSVNHYSSPQPSQIAFPDPGGTRLFDFAGTSRRMRDSAALTRARQAIEESARSGRRVWLVTDRYSASGASELDRRLAMIVRPPARIARVRVEDLRAILAGNFGRPTTTVWPMKGVPRQEEMFAELYGPSSR